MANISNRLAAGLGGFLIACLLFFLVDCAGGSSKTGLAYVYDRDYQEAYVNTHTRIEQIRDDKGNVISTYPVIEQDYHPAEYFLHIEDSEGYRPLRVPESAYRAILIGSNVRIRKHYGRWTGIKHYETLDE